MKTRTSTVRIKNVTPTVSEALSFVAGRPGCTAKELSGCLWPGSRKPLAAGAFAGKLVLAGWVRRKGSSPRYWLTRKGKVALAAAPGSPEPQVIRLAGGRRRRGWSGSTMTAGRPGKQRQGIRYQTGTLSWSGWDASRPRESFAALASRVHGAARRTLLHDGRRAETFSFAALDGSGHVVFWRGDGRDLKSDWLRRHVEECHAYGVVHVVVARMRQAAGPDDRVLRQAMDDGTKASQPGPQDGGEVLIVSAQSRDGWANSWADGIVRDEAGGISLAGCVEVADFRGRFGKVFG